nr:hypothetical protein [Treponema sp.]
EEHIRNIIDSIIKLRHPYKDLPKLGEKVKEQLKLQYKTYNKSVFEGFKPLLDKLLELLEIS